jgi:hypothetical protein
LAAWSQGIEVVGLYVRDQGEALEFYVEKLGFRDPSGNGWKMIQSRTSSKPQLYRSVLPYAARWRSGRVSVDTAA